MRIKSVLRCIATGLFLLLIPYSALLSAEESTGKEGFRAEKSVSSDFSDLCRTAVPNIAAPLDWTLSKDGDGVKKGNVLELNAGKKTTRWSSSSLDFVPGGLYRFSMKACNTGTATGTNPSGPYGVNYDYRIDAIGEKPEKVYSHFAVIPNNIQKGSLLLGEWDAMGTYRFSEAKLSPVLPVFCGLRGNSNEFLPIGSGESISRGQYKYTHSSVQDPGNFSRPLHYSTASFNTARWCLGQSAQLVYKFNLRPVSVKDGKAVRLNSLTLTNMKVSVTIGYYVSGKCILEVSNDGKIWKKIGALDTSKTINLNLSKANCGFDRATTVWFRMTAERSSDNKWASFQIPNLGFEARLEGDLYNGVGHTQYVDLFDQSKKQEYRTIPLFISQDNTFYYIVENLKKSGSFQWQANMSIVSNDRVKRCDPNEIVCESLDGSSTVAAGASEVVAQRFGDLDETVQPVVQLEYDRIYSLRPRFSRWQRQNFTRKIEGLSVTNDNAVLSWCEPEYKVPKNPEQIVYRDAKPICISAPQNDFESFQIVINAKKNMLRDISVTADDLVDIRKTDVNNVKANGVADGIKAEKRIPSSKIEIRYAYYHFVENPTDRTSCIDWWPDALIPIEKGSDGLGAPIDIAKGSNLPIWITVRIDPTVPAGIYSGSIRIKSKDGQLNASVPYVLQVWNFALPKKNRLETAFGISPVYIAQYHNCKTEADKRRVFEMYLQNFSEHRISMYNPAPFDPISVKFRPDTNPPSAELDFTRFDKEMLRVFKQYNFTGFRLQVDGMRGQVQDGKPVPMIGKYPVTSPEYKAMYADYVKQLEEHLKKIGLLDGAYCYWYDEPTPNDYNFVSDGFARLKKNASGIRRMLTEEPNDLLNKYLDDKNAPLDIWCPVTSNFNDIQAKKRMKKNERFWWYVCCEPKEPYCTLFIDHPGTELRVWLWQTFERNIKGILVWTSNWWTSWTAFPSSCQNPYEDPMGYVSGGAPGTRRFWGNGDGRFLYPPLSAAQPGLNGGKPNFDKPVSSIRWEIIREGVQDYEMLTTLVELAKKNKDKMTAEQKKLFDEIFDFTSITKSMTEFTTKAEPIHLKRQQIAELILDIQNLK